ncbi:MAG: hypothetical protein MJZ46_03290 [Bacteroidales bacterium]|nr:hypothetical protein [Bacteroidales bacterium]
MKKMYLLVLVLALLTCVSCKKYNCKYYYNDIKSYYDVSADTWTLQYLQGALDDTAYHKQMYKIEYEMKAFNRQYKYCMKYPITVSTGEIAPKTSGKVVCKGSLSEEVAGSVQTCGFCWSDLSNPVITTDDYVECTCENGEFSCTVTDLMPMHTYYIRAFATTSEGVFYGEAENFKAN